jgi:hypothetical protein
MNETVEVEVQLLFQIISMIRVVESELTHSHPDSWRRVMFPMMAVKGSIDKLLRNDEEPIPA